MSKRKCVALVASLVAIPSAHAAEVPFAATVTSTCQLVVGAPGVMVANGSGTVLSSEEGGGSAGTVAATATGTGFNLSVTSPSAFTAAPTNGGSGVTFQSNYSGTGATTIGETNAGTNTPVNVGVTNVSVDLIASRASGVFPAGAYAASVTVTCE